MYDENLRADEFGQPTIENTQAYETSCSSEVHMPCEVPPTQEFSKPDTGGRQRSNRGAKQAAAALTAILATVGATTAVVPAITEGIYAAAPVEFAFVEYGFELDTLYFTFQTESEEPREAVLSNDFTERRYSLERWEDGFYDGYFEGLLPGVKYTFSIVGDGAFGDRVLYSETVVGPHPIDFASVYIDRFSPDGNAIYYTIEVYSAVPLRAVLTNGQKTYTRDLVDEVNEGVFENLPLGMTYTLTIVGEGLYGKEVVIHEQAVMLPSPFDG